ncbi:hypothetical protein [Halomicrobium salinisoli]|uniref:hypothetical protein n=1 Tax=Halomicrobium salinisoli TaxID=2878391 RepID=UPI001CEFFBCC|nr:hypothetical protein [Halomicrobium salinisoli]
MSPAPDQLREFSRPEEPLVTVHSGSVSANSRWRSASIGLTDRRLLCVADDGGFVTLGYDSICAIRSRSRTKRSYRGADHGLLLGGGALLAVLGLAGVVALATDALVHLAVLGTVAGLAGVTHLRRTPSSVDRETVAGLADEMPAGVDGTDVMQRLEYREIDDADVHWALLIASGSVAALSLLAAVVVASDALVGLATLALLGGLALVDYAFRHRADLEGVEIDREREAELSIDTADGRTVHVRSEPSAGLGEALSRLAFADGESDAPAVAPHSE